MAKVPASVWMCIGGADEFSFSKEDAKKLAPAEKALKKVLDHIESDFAGPDEFFSSPLSKAIDGNGAIGELIINGLEGYFEEENLSGNGETLASLKEHNEGIKEIYENVDGFVSWVDEQLG